MRAIINPYSGTHGWSRELLPEWSLCALPLAGKPFCEHWLDFLLGQETKSVVVEDCLNYSQHLKMTICEGKFIPMEVQYVGTNMDSRISTLIMRNTRFIEEDDILIIWGMVLPMNFGENDIFGNIKPVDVNAEQLPDGIYLLKAGQLYVCDLPLRRIDGIESYFNQNFEILNNPQGFILPGYLAENGIYTGMNVAIKQDVTIKPTVLLGDNINIERECNISDGVIICDNVWVDQGTILRHSIVLNHTYVGKEIQIEDKIVSSGRIIEPSSGEYVDDNGGIAMDIRYLGNFDWLMCYEYFLALFLCIVFLIPYIIYLPFKRLLGKRLWSYKFSADRYPRCWNVLRGKGRLIRTDMNDDNYVFRMSDSFSNPLDEEQQEIYDKFYAHNRSCYLVTKIVIKGLLSRLFINRIPGRATGKEPREPGKELAKVNNPLLVGVLPQLREEISCLQLPKLASVVLGGGYGRGEGGDFIAPDGSHKLYNDLDFFVFTIDASKREKQLIASKLNSVSQKWTSALGIDVDFSYPKNISEMYKMKKTLMYQELRRGNIVVYGNDVVYTHVPKLSVASLPYMEGMRLLMNRGMGLLFAGEHLHNHSSDYDFILRNINKAILGAMDAILIVCGMYKWKLNERIIEANHLVNDIDLPKRYVDLYKQACEFKLRPNRIMPEEPLVRWNEIREFWCDIVRLCLDCSPDSSIDDVKQAMHDACEINDGRSIYNALRWFLHAHSFGFGMLGICDDPTMRLLFRVYEFLSKQQKGNVEFCGCDAELKRLWERFN